MVNRANQAEDEQTVADIAIKYLHSIRDGSEKDKAKSSNVCK
jgi:hypothetical protein